MMLLDVLFIILIVVLVLMVGIWRFLLLCIFMVLLYWFLVLGGYYVFGVVL
jgi:hypothetical protein